jgi:hypothetical protein
MIALNNNSGLPCIHAHRNKGDLVCGTRRNIAKVTKTTGNEEIRNTRFAGCSTNLLTKGMAKVTDSDKPGTLENTGSKNMI